MATRPIHWIRAAASLLAFVLASAHGAVVQKPSGELLERGKYLATAGDCAACHTAKGGAPFAGGLQMNTPFGPIATPNITPDAATGIGNWTDEQFYRAMHDGIGRHGEYLYPVMPFPWYTHVTRDDVLAIKAYLFSLTPVHRPRDASHLSFPFSVRPALGAWRAVFFSPGDFKPDPQQSPEVNRGAYLVNGLAHCGECHDSRLLAGASKYAKPLQGGVIDNWYAPNITSDVHDGIGGWSDEQLVAFMKNGAAPGKGVAIGSMAETVHSLGQLSDSDLHAIAAYLKTTPATAETDHKFGLYQGAQARGASVYLNNCASCHGVDGKGLAGAVPALDGNGAVGAKGPQNVIQVVLGGLEARHGYGPMPAIGAGMSDEDVAEVSNYVRQLGGNAAPPTAQAGMVATLRASTDTLLNGGPNQACPTISSPAVARLAADPHNPLAERLAQVDDSNMATQTERLVAALRSARPKASTADMVNGLTAAYCPVVRGDARLDANAKALRLGHFSELVYMQARYAAGGAR